MVSPGAVVVDVGTNWDEGAGRLVGDVAYDEVAEVAGAISPVPGGVGPLTNLMLVRNLLRTGELLAGG
jgi:methylenetetrahydrofolate dehydrogenase (NADP+)/methenyltetrahydrofolate cyclohydrolase